MGHREYVVKDMLGQVPVFEGSLATASGHTIEPLLAWWVAKLCAVPLTQITLSPTLLMEHDARYIHDGFCWAAVSPDAILTFEDGRRVCLEFKNTSKSDEWGVPDHGLSGIARRYQGQVLWQRLLLDVDEVWAVMSHATKLQIYKVGPHPRREEQLRADAEALWLEHIRPIQRGQA